MKFTFVVVAFIGLCSGDVYMHNPRGSNNRLNERSANRNNANRLFDSQNNNRGGYNAGDQDTGAFNSEAEIYYMHYFQSGGPDTGSSNLVVEWTNQHGCGGDEDSDPHKLNCNLVLQFMCQPGDETDNSNLEMSTLRNGQNTNTQNYQTPSVGQGSANDDENRRNQVDVTRGLHESFDWYDACYTRERNKGLFTADQNLRQNRNGISSAIYTRQNANGNRRGYECPEERDYYPYWHPTPWRDIAILADNDSQCEWYQRESNNQQPRGMCQETYEGGEPKYRSVYNNEEACKNNSHTWVWLYAYLDIDDEVSTEAACTGSDRVWAQPWLHSAPACLVLPPVPECKKAGWTRVNHLGNGRDGVPLNYTWRLPHFPSGSSQRCVLRLRYNISTDDYDPFNTDSSYNQDLVNGIRSPVEQNPNINIGSTTNKPLRLAINTAQFGRTFQDRSHVFILQPRPQQFENLSPEETQTLTIHNLNVRGKRGNIVQTYPSVEYDFIPNKLVLPTQDAVHIQWTGSNTHNNGNPAGDGQAGDAGEGTRGTDRHNIVEIPEPNSNYPSPYENSTMWNNVEVLYKWFDGSGGNGASIPADVALAFATAGYYTCFSNCDNRPGNKDELNNLLNNAPASFRGALLRYRSPGVYHYICSRNNNFTNRSQKGTITVR